jgi:hypothetical protein
MVAVMSAISAVAPLLMTDSNSSPICPAFDTPICAGSATTARRPAQRTGQRPSNTAAPHACPASHQ